MVQLLHTSTSRTLSPPAAADALGWLVMLLGGMDGTLSGCRLRSVSELRARAERALGS